MQLQLRSLNATKGQTRVLQSKEEIFDKLKPIIKDELDVEEAKIKLGASLIDDLEADSLDAVELIMKIEEEFDIEIPDEQAEGMRSVADIVDAISVSVKA